MRRLIVFILVVALVWCGYWAVGSVALDRSLRSWIDDRRGDGWVADYADLSVQGFPNRFDTTFTELDLADPSTGLAWSLPFFQILALSYKPNHVIAVWPNQHHISTPRERLALTSSKMQASLVVEPGPNLTLDRTAFVADAFGISSSAGWQSGASTLRLASRQVAAAVDTHDIAIEATDLLLPTPVRQSLDPLRALPGDVKQLRLATEISFDGPWDRFAIEQRRPQPTAIALDDLTALWGDLELRAAGDLTLDEAGRATGEITVKAVNWRQMLDIAEASGALPEATRPTVESALALLAGLSGPPNTIDAPLTLRSGTAFFGPIPIGQLAPIRIR